MQRCDTARLGSGDRPKAHPDGRATRRSAWPVTDTDRCRRQHDAAMRQPPRCSDALVTRHNAGLGSRGGPVATSCRAARWRRARSEPRGRSARAARRTPRHPARDERTKVKRQGVYHYVPWVPLVTGSRLLVRGVARAAATARRPAHGGQLDCPVARHGPATECATVTRKRRRGGCFAGRVTVRVTRRTASAAAARAGRRSRGRAHSCC
jgi:hypothetical protein